jgi:antitoxin PrlF
MPTATITSKGQITLPREVRELLHVGGGDQVDFQIDEDGEIRIRPLTGSVEDLFGLLYCPQTPPRSVEDIDDTIARFVVADDQRIRRGDGE